MDKPPADICMYCSQLTPPRAFRKDAQGAWHARHRCDPCQKRWEVNLSWREWTESTRGAWYRQYVLNRDGLKAKPALPWAAP